MADDIVESPRLRNGYADEEKPNSPEAKPPATRTPATAAENRGKRAPRSGSGAVVGSGAGAGGGGGAEDFDSDPMGGGGTMPRLEDDHPKSGADAPVGGSR